MHQLLVGGCPRSGTTLVGSLLARDDVLVVPESDWRWDLLRHADDDGRMSWADVADRLATDARFAPWRVVPGDLPRHGRTGLSALLDTLVTLHAAALGRPAPHAWVDHTPWNLKFAPTLARMLPRARFVHVLRDGRGVAASVLPLDWGPTTVDHAATWWAAQLAPALAAGALLGDRLRTVRFEDVVVDPEATTTLLREHAGHDAPSASAGGTYEVDAYTRDQHALVGGPTDASRATAWRDVLSAREVEVFERRTGDLLGSLGYEQSFGVRARSPSRGRRTYEVAVGTLRRHLRDRPRRARRNRLRTTAHERRLDVGAP